MDKLQPITALGSFEPRSDTIETVTFTECPDWALTSLSPRKNKSRSTSTALKKAIGLTLPKPMRFNSHDNMIVFWVGQDQYFVEAPINTHEELASQLKSELGARASITEQTDGFVRFDAIGEGVSDCFERLCILNTRVMISGDANRTTVEQIGCYILCKGDNHFSIYGARSMAVSLHHALLISAQSVFN